MKRSFLYFSVLFLLAGLFYQNQANASHALGADLSYECLGNNKYKFRLTLFRDCAGILPPNTFSLVGQAPSCNGNSSVVLTLASVHEMSGCVVPNGATTCNGGTFPGLQEVIYEGVDSLPSKCIDWHYYVNHCCRAAQVSNLNNPGATSIFVETWLNNTICNNSPVFKPVYNPFACDSSFVSFPFTASEPDGDSLVYYLDPAKSGPFPGSSVSYQAGATGTNPIPGSPVTINGQTGNLTFNSLSPQQPVVCVKIDEYRNGLKIGSVKREFTILIIDCDSTQNYCGSNILSGHVYIDSDSNCIRGNSEVTRQYAMVKVSPGPLYSTTDANGYYQFNLKSGNYTVDLVNNNPFYDLNCPKPSLQHNVNFPAVMDSSSNNDFGLNPISNCALMQVSVGTWAIRPCQKTVLSVNYCNVGSDTAFNAAIDLTLDTNIQFINTTGNLVAMNGNTLTFSLDTVLPNHCGKFSLKIRGRCDTSIIGRTLCIEAHAYPDSLCESIDSTWDKSSVQVTGYCKDDSLACFIIENTGDPGNGNMQGTSQYRIYEDSILVFTGTFQLNGGDSIEICWPAQGKTIRLEADQRPGHPGNSHPNHVVENCGTPNNSQGLVNLFPQDDADPFKDVFCLEVTAAVDPNDKQVFPLGVMQTRNIKATDQLEYMIRFQNTGNDTAFKVVIEDTLDPALDITTVQPGAASHKYQFKIYGQGILQWTFDNILLPDSTTNEPQSHGFVIFSVKQKAGNPNGTIIKNKAGIVFDIQAPIVTNEVWNTVGQTMHVSRVRGMNTLEEIIAYPNPFREAVNFKMAENHHNVRIEVYDLTGRTVVSKGLGSGKEFSLERGNLQTGVYVFRLIENGNTFATGKLMVE